MHSKNAFIEYVYVYSRIYSKLYRHQHLDIDFDFANKLKLQTQLLLCPYVAATQLCRIVRAAKTKNLPPNQQIALICASQLGKSSARFSF